MKKFPDYFAHGAPLTVFFETYPYALPSLICGSFSTLMLILAICFVKETQSIPPEERDSKDNGQLLRHTSRKAYSTFNDSDRLSKMASAGNIATRISTKTKGFLRMFSLDDCMTMAVLSVCAVHTQFTFQTGFYRGMYKYWIKRKSRVYTS